MSLELKKKARSLSEQKIPEYKHLMIDALQENGKISVYVGFGTTHKITLCRDLCDMEYTVDHGSNENGRCLEFELTDKGKHLARKILSEN